MYYADLGRGIGSEQEGYRPAVIIQNNVGNKHSPTVIIASITSKTGVKAKLPTHYYIDAEDGLELPSIVLLEQLRTVDKRRLGNFIGHLSEKHICGINHALAVSIGLIESVPKKLILCLCSTCADNFYGTGAYYLRRIDPHQTAKDTCTYWGDKKLRSIRTKTVDDFYHFLLNEAEPATNMGKPKREHISPSTIHDIHKVLRCAFNQAKKWEYIAKNPFLDATLPEHKEAKRDALTPEQLQKVLDFTDRTDIYDLYVMHCAIQLAFACCMRGGEVGGTQWERFSRSDQVLYIDRVIDRVDKKLIEKLPKMDILFRFPNLYPGTRTVIVLKQPKTEGSIRTVYIPETVAKKLEKLREMQMKLKLELGDDGYMDYGLIICQANGRPIMTEHLNKRFKEVLIGLNDPTINVDNVVFHSLRHTSTGVKLRLSKGDLKAVQGDGGWNSPDMVTKRYAHILDEDRRRLADEMEQSFYKGKTEETPVAVAPSLDAEALASLLASNPELLKKALESVQLANNT